MGFGFWVLGFRVQGVGFRVYFDFSRKGSSDHIAFDGVKSEGFRI